MRGEGSPEMPGPGEEKREKSSMKEGEIGKPAFNNLDRGKERRKKREDRKRRTKQRKKRDIEREGRAVG